MIFPLLKRGWKPLAWALTVVLFLTLAILWPGADAADQQSKNPDVWVLQTGEGKRFGRVNTEVLELNTVREVSNPSRILQNQNDAYVFTDGNQKYSRIDEAFTLDIDEKDTEDAINSPAETVDVQISGDDIVFLTADGKVFLQNKNVGLQEIQIFDDSKKADLMVVNDQGLIAALSLEAQEITVFDYRNLKIVETSSLQTSEATAADTLQLSLFAQKWALFDENEGTLVWQGAEQAVTLDTSGAVFLQAPSMNLEEVFLADSAGLWKINVATSLAERTVELPVVSEPAKPIAFHDKIYAAWLADSQGYFTATDMGVGAGADSGAEQGAELKTLQYGALSLPQEKRPVFVSNGDRVVLNEQRSGWVWSMPEGILLDSSQHWRYDDKPPVTVQEATETKVADPKPPVAVDDSFGVRAGRAVKLPVLLNDYDPNDDILVIDAESIEGVDTSFLDVRASQDGQVLVANINETASGTTSFKYRVSDGSSGKGFISEPATVTITVKDQSDNEAPEWCGVDECLSQWEPLTVAVGTTAKTNVLDAFVDPESDPFYLKGYTAEDENGRVIVSSDGVVTFQHSGKDLEGTATRIPINLEVYDSHGAATQKQLLIEVKDEGALAVKPFAITGVKATQMLIDLSDHVEGATGRASLQAVSVIDSDRAVAQDSVSGDLSFSFRAQDAGSYLLQVTVQDEVESVTDIIRVDTVPPENAIISAPPITAFVRPSEDVTVDLLDGVFDPLDAALSITQITVQPEEEAFLQADTVGNKYVRASGDVNTSGGEGLLGTVSYTITDGTEKPGRTARGEITFIMLPVADDSEPIAVDDYVTVQAGAQIDIPVLDNDVAPLGSQIQLDPASVKYEGPGLAFANDRLLRFLAPDEIGQYVIEYEVYRLGNPSQRDTASVHITVRDEGNDFVEVAPLVARTLSGSTVSIPVSQNISDREYEDVTALKIGQQPEQGIAVINHDLNEIVYESADDFSGQIGFSYEYVTGAGVWGTGLVKVGVINEDLDSRPVTYSDYLQVQVGESNAVSVYPLENDIDPSATALQLVEVVPNEQEGTPEYEELQNRVDSSGMENGFVKISAGKNLGTFSYRYAAQNELGDSSEGLIVLKVVREPVTDYPRVEDTKLSSEDVASLRTGVDVLHNKVSWYSGNTESLEVSLWRDEEGFNVTQNKIVGVQKETPKIIPFAVTGENFSQQEVKSYAFLRVPGQQSDVINVRSSFQELQVTENDSIEIDLNRAVLIPDGKKIEIQAAGVRTGGNRATATCESVAEGTIRYRAGAGAPWSDTCLVPVKFHDQEDYTVLVFKIKIIAEKPDPQLRNASITVKPGEALSFDLTKMVKETSESLQNLKLSATYDGELFVVEQNGSHVLITAKDTAKQGREEAVRVALTDYKNVKSASLRLTVGASPQTLPKGATVVQSCSATDNSGTDSAGSCLIKVVGVEGEVNPFPNTPLKLVSVTEGGSCSNVKFSVAGKDTVRAQWADDSAGAADCKTRFTVEDAQNRSSSGQRQGTIILDLRGLPKSPRAVDWARYDSNSVSLRVHAGANSYPAATQYLVQSSSGETYTCQISETCEITGLKTGDEQTFNVTAVNSVGESQRAVSVTAWAYSPPKTPKGSFKPVPSINGSGDLIRLNIDEIDHSTASLLVTSEGSAEEKVVQVKDTAISFDYFLNSTAKKNVYITPQTKYRTPPSGVRGPKDEASQPLVISAHGIGKPNLNVSETTVTFDPAGVRLHINVEPKGGRETRIGFGEDGSCSPSETLDELDFEHFFAGNIGEATKPAVCVEHVFEGVSFGKQSWNGEFQIEIPPPAEGNYFISETSQEQSDGTLTWGPIIHSFTEIEGFTLVFRTQTGQSTNLDELLGRGTTPGPVHAHFCVTDSLDICSAPTPVTVVGHAYAPVVTFLDLEGEEGFCLPNLLDSVQLNDPEGILDVSVQTEVSMETELGEETDGGEETSESWILVKDPAGQFAPIVSASCLNEGIL